MRIILALLIAAITLPALAQTPARDPSVSTPGAEAVVGRPSGPPLSGEALDEKTREVASLLRCPVCQGMSIFDSPAPMAVNMKHQTRDLLARGYDRDQILRYFESSYGEFVRLDPPFRGIDSLVWILPFLALVAGGLIVAASARKLRVSPAPAGQTQDDAYLEAVRRMAGDGEKRP
jgi:cytochrome c-type biogenesis protein CcmH